MRKTNVLFSVFLLLGVLAIAVISCKKDEPVDMALVSLMAGDIDLNGATAPDNVPVSPTITATFTANVDVSTATAANITLTQNYDDADIAITISVSGATITITPDETLGTGTLFELDLGVGIESTDGKALTALTRSFTTNGTFAPAGVIAHWTFEDNANDVVGSYDPTANGIVAITYTASRNTEAGKAATFDGNTSIIEIPNGDQLINTTEFTISFWVKTNSTGHVNENGDPAGHFVLGLGAFYGIEYEIYGAYDGGKFAVQYDLGDGTSTSEDMWFPSLATDNTNGGWQGWDFAKSLTVEEMQAMLKDTWLNVVYTFDGSTKRGTLYYNGEKMKSFDFNLWDVTDAKHGVVGMKWGGTAPDVVNELAFGFIQSRAGTMWDAEPWGGYDIPTSNHFKGQLDDVRIFHKAISATEVQLMYDSEKP
jgi:hypothetical protein